MVDLKGNLYQNTLQNLVKRNEFTDEQILDICDNYLSYNPTDGVTKETLF